GSEGSFSLVTPLSPHVLLLARSSDSRWLRANRPRRRLGACRAPHCNRVARGKGHLDRLIKFPVALFAIHFFAARAHGPINSYND
ncbi:MAG: hypothetical protein ACREMY_20125, partial [bacterium]